MDVLCQLTKLQGVAHSDQLTRASQSSPSSHQLRAPLLYRGFWKFLYFIKRIQSGFAIAPGRILNLVEVCCKK